MAGRTKSKRRTREPLTRERVLRAAITLADTDGLASLSMRRLGQELRVEAMSLYNHVANKDEILDGIIDVVVAEIELPAQEADWKTAMRQRALSAHEVLLRHPWACALIEGRTQLGPARLRYFDAVLGSLRSAGFSVELAMRAFFLLDSYVYGFTLHEVSWPFDADGQSEVVASLQPSVSAERYPHLSEVMASALESQPNEGRAGEGGGFAGEFEFGLELILDGLERALHRADR